VKILASSATIESLEKVVNEYFYSIDYQLKESGAIYNRRLNCHLEGFTWSKKGKRFYFKQVEVKP
jgi:hypothetical protein